jgi:hypothetical protein
MTWLVWRQSRLQFLIAACALLVLTLAFALTEPGLNHLYAEYGAHPAAFLAQVRTGDYPVLYFAGGAVVYLTPLIIGAFWGAPMIARELETGTYRLTWNQSVTRTRWLLVKIAITGGAATIFAGIAGLLLSWWAGPIDRVGGFPIGTSQLSRFAPIVFGTRGIVPIGAAALAFMIGVTAGLIVGRTVPAMGLTLAVFAAALVAMPLWISPHLITPAQYTRPVVANLTTMEMTSSGQLNGPVTSPPGAWILADEIITAYLAKQPLRQHVVYQPASRYWAFQILETVIWLAIAVALTGFCTWRIRRRG